MNPNDRNPGSSRPSGNNNPPDPSKRRPSQPDYIGEKFNDFFDPEESIPYESARDASSPGANDRYPEESGGYEDETVPVEEVTEFEKENGEPIRTGAKEKRAQGADKPDGKSFFETLGDGLRSAGETAQRYTNIGVNHAGLEKLRYHLRTAHAELGELAMRCWADAPDVGLTARDPAVVDVIKRIKLLRLKIREKQAKIAELKKG